MTPDEKRIKIAEACGWHGNVNGLFMRPPNTTSEYIEVPDYLNDLNAMHEAEKILNSGQINAYIDRLYSFIKVAKVGSNPWEIIAARVAIHSTAAQRAEAFGKTLNLW